MTTNTIETKSMRTGRRAAILRLWAMGVLCALTGRAGAQDAIGKTLRIVGSAQITRGERTRPLQARAGFQAGDRLRVLPGSAVTLVYYANGARYELAAQSSYRIETGGPRLLTGRAPRLLSPLYVALVKAAGQTPTRFAGTVIRGAAQEGAPRPLRPIGAARDLTVVLRWERPAADPTAEETQWEVRIRQSDNARTVWRQTLGGEVTECALPAGLLRPGTCYEWIVCAAGGSHNGASCLAPLYVLTDDERACLQALEQSAARLQKAGTQDWDSDRLLAEMYERMGLYQDALRVCTDLAHAYPNDTGVQAALSRLHKVLQMP